MYCLHNTPLDQYSVNDRIRNNGDGNYGHHLFKVDLDQDTAGQELAEQILFLDFLFSKSNKTDKIKT